MFDVFCLIRLRGDMVASYSSSSTPCFLDVIKAPEDDSIPSLIAAEVTVTDVALVAGISGSKWKGLNHTDNSRYDLHQCMHDVQLLCFAHVRVIVVYFVGH